ncbi:MAG: UvrD-helicase domain-containing protein [Eubacteriales bacterium]|nr:UvrD-helicase domain-containing protein [Eubacteriales bacterium]
MQNHLAGLNPEQRAAVLYGDGPLLVLAGAGSGKTRVITHRIAHLIAERGVYPSRILAITFTNKAAREMKDRLASILGDEGRGIWCGTFHSMFLRILREHAEVLGFRQNFTILGVSEQESFLKELMGELKISSNHYPPRTILNHISYAKSRLLSPTDFQQEADESYDLNKQAAAKIYPSLQRALKEANAMDFDDILNYAVELFQEHKGILQAYQERFCHILVDEYQDSNQAQYLLVHLLAGKDGNLCVVGDDDQSIYAFRGADLNNILNFERDYPTAKVIKLEQNYRSSAPILAAANGVIACNRGRKPKRLWTERQEGQRVIVFQAEDNYSEARFIAAEIKQLLKEGKKESDIAILYRLNALSRNLEFALREAEIAYRIYGGTGFYERSEIKTALAYLQFILNSEDSNALRRILQTPRRGVGEISIQKLEAAAAASDGDLFRQMLNLDERRELRSISAKLSSLNQGILNLQKLLDSELSFPDWLLKFLELSGLEAHFTKEARSGSEEAASRLENLRELISDAKEYTIQTEAEWESLIASQEIIEQMPEETLSSLERKLRVEGSDAKLDLRTLLTSFLERAALFSSLDEAETESVTLLTTHAAKGAEYPYVFVIGMEEGLFPSYRSFDDPKALEEERRLCYVAMTRAKERLLLSHARSRLLYGQTKYNTPSRFLGEIPEDSMLNLGGLEGSAGVSSKQHFGTETTASDLKRRLQEKLFSPKLKKGVTGASKSAKDKSKIDKQSLNWRNLETNALYFSPKLGEVKLLEILSLGEDAILSFEHKGKKRRFIASQIEVYELDK